jgi:hypothetical protein
MLVLIIVMAMLLLKVNRQHQSHMAFGTATAACEKAAVQLKKRAATKEKGSERSAKTKLIRGTRANSHAHASTHTNTCCSLATDACASISWGYKKEDGSEGMEALECRVCRR